MFQKHGTIKSILWFELCWFGLVCLLQWKPLVFVIYAMRVEFLPVWCKNDWQTGNYLIWLPRCPNNISNVIWHICMRKFYFVDEFFDIWNRELINLSSLLKTITIQSVWIWRDVEIVFHKLVCLPAVSHKIYHTPDDMDAFYDINFIIYAFGIYT